MPDFQRPGGAEHVTDEMIAESKEQIDAYMANVLNYPRDRYEGRGIVMVAGGRKYLPCAYVNLRIIRNIGCTLPVEIWHIGETEVDEYALELFKDLDVEFVDCMDIIEEHPCRRMGGWEMNPYSIIHSKFEEVMFLDADNIALIDLATVFEWPEYERTGAVFWPDFGRLPASRSIWKLLQIEYRDEPEFESGQIIVNKRKCWKELNLTMCLNEYSDTYYQHVWGDKETYHMAWRYLGTEYTMPDRGIHRLRATMCQHDLEGNIIFQHRNMDKFRLERTNARISGFQLEDDCFKYLNHLRGKWDGVMHPPIPRTREELRVFSGLAGSTYGYTIADGNPRELELLADGNIGKGHMECEQQWYVRERKDGVKLYMCGHAVTAVLAQDTDGIWRGRWLGNEMHDCSLTPTDQASLQLVHSKQHAASLAGEEFLYIRSGFDKTPCKLTPDGKIVGIGANERAWWITSVHDISLLCIAPTTTSAPICMLTECRDGIWRGYWTKHEKMAVELIPQGD